MPLSRLAALHGVATSFSPSPGRTVAASDAAVVAVLAALGVAAGTPDAVRTALTARETELRERLLPRPWCAGAGRRRPPGVTMAPGRANPPRGRTKAKRAPSEGPPAPDENPPVAGEDRSGASENRPAPDEDAAAPGGSPSVTRASAVGGSSSALPPGPVDPRPRRVARTRPIRPPRPDSPGTPRSPPPSPRCPPGPGCGSLPSRGRRAPPPSNCPWVSMSWRPPPPTDGPPAPIWSSRRGACPRHRGVRTGCSCSSTPCCPGAPGAWATSGTSPSSTAWAGRALGAGFVQVNPMHAAVPGAPTDPSPYRPSSRRFPDPVYLRVEDVPEYALRRRGRPRPRPYAPGAGRAAARVPCWTRAR